MDEVRGRKLSESQRKLMLDLLDKQEAQNQPKMAAYPCFPYRRDSIRLVLVYPGGAINEVRVASRNLSARGISVLYPGFIYEGTRTSVTLHRRLGGEETVNAAVPMCTHVAGTYHIANIEFNQCIFPELFLDEGTWSDHLSEKEVAPASPCADGTGEGAVLVGKNRLSFRKWDS